MVLEHEIELNKQRVHLEAERVQAKFASSVDTTSEVILRFDFMNNHDTRVCFSMLSPNPTLDLGIYWVSSSLFGIVHRWLCLWCTLQPLLGLSYSWFNLSTLLPW